MKLRLFLFLTIFYVSLAEAQKIPSNRSSVYFTYGNTGSNLREFNQMLDQKGLSPMRKSYRNFGFGYQTRYNDFVLGLELFQNNSPKSLFNGYDLDYRTSRVYLNVGYSFTEEGRFQLIHYMSLGSGFVNFQMLRENPNSTLDGFLQNPAHGFILRDGDIHKGSQHFAGFLTEIGFQLSYDVEIPGREEMVEVITKFGYSFSPFEESWLMKGIAFGNAQSGPFLRFGAGITLPDHNFFYKDASLGLHLTYGMHFTKPDVLNAALVENGYRPFEGRPNNLGLKLLGESKGLLYGIDFYNLGLSGTANESSDQTLNSVRVYLNGGLKFFERRNLELGGLAGLGYGNLRYTLSSTGKPNFPALFEEPEWDGFLKARGLMGKPELYIAYGIPLTDKNLFSMIVSLHGGYELPLGNYTLGDVGMSSYMANPYLQLSLGLRP